MPPEEEKKLRLALNILAGRMDPQYMSLDCYVTLGYDYYRLLEMGTILTREECLFDCIEIIMTAIKGAYEGKSS